MGTTDLWLRGGFALYLGHHVQENARQVFCVFDWKNYSDPILGSNRWIRKFGKSYPNHRWRSRHKKIVYEGRWDGSRPLVDDIVYVGIAGG